MLDVLEVQDQLKNFSQEQLLREMQMPTGNVPQFLVLSELNRRRTMSQDLAKRQSADQPTVKEEVVASSGMPMEKVSMMAQQMAPKTSMTENTGIASMMPRELPSEEEPMKMSYGGLLMGSRMMNQMAAPLARDILRPAVIEDERRSFFPAMQRRFSSGLDNLGRDISGRVQNRTQEEVQDFIGEVDNMAQERFEVNLSEPSQRQRDMQSFLSGKGQPPRAIAMKDGGPIKAQSGMFAQMMPKFPTPPAFATIYNYAKTVLGLDDELARDVATKTLEQGEIDKSQLGMFSAKPFGSVEERLSGDDRLAQRKALDTFTGGAEMNQLVDQLSEPEVKDVQDVDDVPDLDLTQVNPLFSAKPFGTVDQRMSGFDDALAQRKALDNFTGGREMSDLVNQLSKEPEEEVTPSLNLNPLFSAKPFGNLRDRFKGSTLANQGLPKNRNFLPEEPSFPDVQKQISGANPLAKNIIARDQQLDKLFSTVGEKPVMPKGISLDDVEDKSGKLPMTDMPDKKDDEDDAGAGTKTGLGGGLGGIGGAGSALSELEAQIDKLKSDREKGRQSEKWFALAEVGLGMLASQNPTVLGALGEGGLRGLKSLREGKKDYDKDMLSYLTTKASIQKTRGDQALKSAYYQGVLKNAEAKISKSGFTQKDLLNAIKDKDKLILDYQTKYPTNKPVDYEQNLLNLRAEREALYNRLEPSFKPLVVDPQYDATKVN